MDESVKAYEPKPVKKMSAGSGNNGKESSVICDNMNFAAKESYKRLRTNIIFSFPNEGKCRVVGITSAQPGEGKTVTSINLSYSLAELGKKVLYIDADMRRSSVGRKLNIPSTPGLSNLMVDLVDLSSAIREYRTKSGIEFDIIAGGDVPPNPAELLSSDRMKSLFEALGKVYEYIIVDLPPVCAVVDALAVSANLDGMLVVLREQHTAKNSIAYCVEQLQFSGVKILGFVLNGSYEGMSKKYSYKKYGYRYSYGYGYRKSKDGYYGYSSNGYYK